MTAAVSVAGAGGDGSANCSDGRPWQAFWHRAPCTKPLLSRQVLLEPATVTGPDTHVVSDVSAKADRVAKAPGMASEKIRKTSRTSLIHAGYHM